MWCRGLTNVVDIANGRDHFSRCTRTAPSSWARASGQLGHGPGAATQSATPVVARGVTDARAVFANGNYGLPGARMARRWPVQNGNGQLPRERRGGLALSLAGLLGEGEPVLLWGMGAIPTLIAVRGWLHLRVGLNPRACWPRAASSTVSLYSTPHSGEPAVKRAVAAGLALTLLGAAARRHLEPPSKPPRRRSLVAHRDSAARRAERARTSLAATPASQVRPHRVHPARGQPLAGPECRVSRG